MFESHLHSFSINILGNKFTIEIFRETSNFRIMFENIHEKKILNLSNTRNLILRDTHIYLEDIHIHYDFYIQPILNNS